jgi:hypothetical protein
MCCNNCNCQHPDKREGKVGDCSAEQIKECHGTEEEHACIREEKPEA